MRLSWNEVKARAAAFAKKWRDAEYEKGETHSFYDDFFRIFGVARYEEHVQKLDDRSGFIDLFWPSKLIVEQKSAGRDLNKAYGQAGEYFDALPEKERPRYILVSDFQTFELHDLGERAVTRFNLQDFRDHVESFGFILDVERRVFRDQDPANVEAAELVGRVHDALAAAGYSGRDLERFLVRLVFCLFADDTGIFEPRDILFDLLESRTSQDGADFGLWLSQLFQVLNTPAEARQATLDEDLGRFPYVNGDLFDGPLSIPSFDFPVRIAETALWMMDHIMNNQLSLEFGRTYTRIPLARSPNIVHGDALEMNWDDVLASADCDFVFGNPPFRGKSQQSKQQAAQVRRVAELGKQGGTLDYVAAWFIKAGAYVGQAGKPARIGLVATNSVTQGEQVGLLWPVLFDRHDLDLAFAHRTFAWGSDARGKAHVHVVIVGLDRGPDARPVKRLFSYADVNGEPDEQRCRALSPYLFDASRMTNPRLTVQKVSRPINGLRRLKTGVQMIDNGLLTFTGDERDEFLAHEPGAAKFFRRYIGGDEYINGFHRWILYLAEASPAELRRLPRVADRVAAVRRYRASRSRESTVRMASYPTRVGVDHRLAEPFLVLPNTSSERRHYIPVGWLTPEVVANQKLRFLPQATLGEFALLTSAMHMA